MIKVASVEMKAEAAAKAGAATFVCPPDNVTDVPEGLSLATIGVSSLQDLLACALMLPDRCGKSLKAKANVNRKGL